MFTKLFSPSGATAYYCRTCAWNSIVKRISLLLFYFILILFEFEIWLSNISTKLSQFYEEKIRFIVKQEPVIY